MTYTVAQVMAAAESMWPSAGAEDWDAPGLVVGDPNQSVNRILLSVDVTSQVLDEAIDGGFDLVISHHPYLMRGVTSLAENTLKGAVVARAIRHGIALFAAHTNADIVHGGVSDTLAAAIGLVDVMPLQPVSEAATIGHGRVGNLPAPMSLAAFAEAVGTVLPATASGLRVAGSRVQQIKRVAVLGGAGDSFLAAAAASGADVYVTSDLRHHPAQDALESAGAAGRAFALIDVPHWAAESLWLRVAEQQLAGIFEDAQIVVSGLCTDPWDFVVN